MNSALAFIVANGVRHHARTKFLSQAFLMACCVMGSMPASEADTQLNYSLGLRTSVVGGACGRV